jgi:pimeloyl-ACP methyl ester carboxylesterase
VSERVEVRPGLTLCVERAGVGGPPLLLIHGWPETRRIWARNVEPLAAAGFEVIAPDLRGFGDSDLAPDGFYDLAAHARDLAGLLEVFGHDSCVAAGGDLGGAILVDLGLRFPGLVTRQCVFNAPLPRTDPDWRPDARVRMAADYYVRQGREADALAAELATPEQRMRYVAEFYGHRFWAAPGTFSREDAAWHAAPFADAERFRASLSNYESAQGRRELSEVPRFFEPSPVPTLVLYGPEDHVIPRDFPALSAAAFPDRTGPLLVPDSGHFLQWEASGTFNAALAGWLQSG